MTLLERVELTFKVESRLPSSTNAPLPSTFTFHQPQTMSLKRKAGEIATDAAKKPKNASITSFFGAPKPSPVIASNKTDPTTAPATTPIVFDKEAWVAKLSDEQKELLKLEIDTLHESWLGALKDEVTSDSFLNLKRFLKREQDSGAKIFPPMEDVYSWYVVLAKPPIV
jgi:uracil-DNA glycosylase